MKKQKGQALVETAIILPLLILLIMGLFEFGRAMFLRNTLNNAARAGARTAVVTPKFDADHPTGMSNTDSTLQLTCTDSDFTRRNGPVYKTICNSIYNGIPKTEVTVSITISDLVNPPSGLSAGDGIDVRLTWDKYEAILPLLIPITNTLTGEASMRYE